MTDARYVGKNENGWCNNDDHLIWGDHQRQSSCVAFITEHDQLLLIETVDETHGNGALNNGRKESIYVETHRPY